VSNHVTTIKAFRVGEGDNVEWKIHPYNEFVDMYMFDNGWVGSASSNKAAAYGGTGHQFNWNSLDGVNTRKPFFLSGGVDPTDGQKVKAFAEAQKNFFAVDVNSRFEVEPGNKDMGLVKTFLDDIK
jgi:phosphoribosylanthranilate isomerase